LVQLVQLYSLTLAHMATPPSPPHYLPERIKYFYFIPLTKKEERERKLSTSKTHRTPEQL